MTSVLVVKRIAHANRSRRAPPLGCVELVLERACVQISSATVWDLCHEVRRIDEHTCVTSPSFGMRPQSRDAVRSGGSIAKVADTARHVANEAEQHVHGRALDVAA
jgi:hypothetical protein